MSKGVTSRPIHAAYRSAVLLGFRNTALMIEGLKKHAEKLDCARPENERKSIGEVVAVKIGCIRSTMENERSDYGRRHGEWFGWNRMNIFLSEMLKGVGLGLAAYWGCSAAGSLHLSAIDQPSYMLAAGALAGLARGIWLTARSSREKLIQLLNRSLSELERRAKEEE